MARFTKALQLALLLLARETRTRTVPDGLIVLDPNRGDTWTKGGSYSVLWTSMRDDIALCLSVEISLLRGTQPVDSMTTENDGAALFYVSSTVSDGSNYRLSLRCVQPATLRTALVGHSDIFSVESAAEAFSVTAPEAGAAWPVGTERLVRWALARPVMGSEACEEVNVLLIGRGLGSGTEERLVRSVTVPAAAGAEHALYASGDLQPGSYGVRVQCAGDTALGGESGRFQIVPNPSALVLIAPGPSTACLIGHACEVAWTSSVRGAASPECAQLSGALVDGARALLAFRVPNEPARAGKDVGRHALYLPGSLAPTLRAHLELRCARDSSVRASSRPFRVVRDVGALELVEPHAGSVWGSGQTHTARWLTSLAGSANCSAVDVDLLHGGTVRASWPAAANSGSLQIYIPGDSAPAADYAVRIGCAGDASLRATSAPFEVAPDPTALTLTSPAPRARWTAGSVELVAWRASDALRESASCAHVDVAVRRDTVRVHAARVPNNGRYAFYVNASLAPGDDYSIALACAADPAVRAESVAFAVVPLDAPFRFETPTARSEWMRGQSYAVRWASPLQLSDACATVRLELVAELPEPIDFEHAADGRQAPPPAAALEAPNSGRAWLTVGRTAALPAGGLGTARVEISCTRDRALRGRTEAFTVREACSGVGCARPADGSGDDVAETAEWAAALARGGSSAAAGSFAMPTGVAAGADVSPARGGDDGVGARARERDAGAPSAMPLVGIDEEGGGAFDGGGGGGGGGGLGAAMLGARDVAAVRRPCDEGGHVTCGLAHSCALTSSGGLLCWGQNSEGQTDVPPGHTWLQVSAGVTHTCGVTTDRTLECWGGKHRWTPIDHHEAALPGGELWGAVAAGHAFSCALTMSHRLYCWGYGTELGGDRPPRGLLWRSVTVGESHACGVTSDGALACWGNNAESQAAPPERSGEWRMVATHHRHTCGVTADAQLVCWGANDAGQCDVPRGFRWAAASTGHSHSCGLTTQGLMRCWGHLTFGLGNAPPGYRWAELALGMYHACGLVEGAGDVLCWGMDYHGETDVPDGFRFWDGCDNLGSAAARAVESEHKPGKLACPQHELLDTADGFATRDAVELRCGELDCASYTWSRESDGADGGRAWFCKHDYFEQTNNALQFARWEVGRPVTGCSPVEGDIKLSSYPAGELLSFAGGAWGTVCRLGFGEGSALAAATVACRQLGYVRAVRTYEYVGAPHMAQSVQGVRCAGDESRLAGCARPTDERLCSHEYGDVGIHCVGEPGMATPSPCGSGHASSIRIGAEDARALLLHGSVAVGSEAPHSFDGRLRYTSGGLASHGRARAEARARAHSAPARAGAARAWGAAVCACALVAVALGAAVRNARAHAVECRAA